MAHLQVRLYFLANPPPTTQCAQLDGLLADLEIEVLPISFSDTEQYLSLPLHHRDPFDRMLIAQAITHSLTIVSADKVFEAYPVVRLWNDL